MAARAAEFPALPRAKAPKRVHARLSQSGHGTKDRRGTFAKVEVIPRAVERPGSLIGRPRMDTTTLLIIVLIVLLLGGGGWYGRGRWY